MNDSDESPASAKLDTSVPHSARVWNYWLGGKDNFQADRAVGDQFEQLYPDITVVARSSRAFLKRAVTFLATEAGIRQFLDVGTGMPTAENTHQVAQAVAPQARVVYVDNDPLVLVHARALLTGTQEGATEYIDADLRDPAAILEAASQTTLDLSQPIGLILMNILGHLPGPRRRHQCHRRARLRGGDRRVERQRPALLPAASPRRAGAVPDRPG